MALLDFDKFDLIKELLRNRLKIVWCTRRERAQSEDERARIEVRPSGAVFVPKVPHGCCEPWKWV